MVYCIKQTEVTVKSRDFVTYNDVKLHRYSKQDYHLQHVDFMNLGSM